MLDIFRKASKTWIVKLLFALLALSFVAWGVGDFVRRGIYGTSPAIVVGDVSMSGAEVNAEFKRDLDQLQTVAGSKLTAEDARKMGLMERTIQTLVTRTLIDLAGHDLDLVASDDAIVRAVQSDPKLQDEKGHFDRARLQMILARMGMTEESYLKLERANQIRNQMADALTGGVDAPDALVMPLIRRREEQRSVSAILVRDSAVPPPAPPDQATLEAYYKAHSANFMAPEYRGLSVLFLRPADVADQVQITDDMVADAYKQRRDEFNTPEHRQLSQILIQNDADAAKAGDMVKAGKDLPDIAKALGLQVLGLGTVAHDDLPAGLADPVFAQAQGSVGQPVKTDLGWHVIKVVSVTPGTTRSLADARGQIETDLRRDKALDLLNTLSNKVEDTLGGGATLEETAKKFNLTLLKIPAVDSHGNGTDGKPVAGLPKVDSFLDLAFQTDQGEESQMTDNGDDGYFMVRVDSVAAPAPRPLANITAPVVQAWQAEQRHADAETIAKRIADRLKAGDDAAAVAKALGGEVLAITPFSRDNVENAGLPAALASAVFEHQPGDVVSGAMTGGWAAVRVDRITPFDPKTHAQEVAAARKTISQSAAGDLIDEYLSALNAHYGVQIDRSQMTREE